MQGRQRQVAGVGQLHGGVHGGALTHLADQDHIWRFTQGALQGAVDRQGVLAQLALVDDGALVGVHKLNRIFDRENMTRGVLVAMIDHARLGGGFAGAGGADHQHHAALEHDQVFQHFWRAEQIQNRRIRLHKTQHHGDAVALHEHVDAETAEAPGLRGEVDFKILLEVLLLLRREDAHRQLFNKVRRHLRFADGEHLALDLEHGRCVGGEENIGSVLFYCELQIGQNFEHREVPRPPFALLRTAGIVLSVL